MRYSKGVSLKQTTLLPNPKLIPGVSYSCPLIWLFILLFSHFIMEDYNIVTVLPPLEQPKAVPKRVYTSRGFGLQFSTPLGLENVC